MKVLLLLFLFTNIFASDKYSLRVAYGEVSKTDLGEILSGDISGYNYDLSVLALDAGYLLGEAIYELPIDLYVKTSLSYFNEDDLQDDIYEGTLFIKAYWNIDFFKNRVRFGFGEGVSYTSDILYTEYIEVQENGDNTSRLLNYLDISLDFDIGRAFSYKPLFGTALGMAIKHRSGVFGLFNNVSHGGSNYNTFYIEKNF